MINLSSTKNYQANQVGLFEMKEEYIQARSSKMRESDECSWMQISVLIIAMQNCWGKSYEKSFLKEITNDIIYICES